MKQKSAGSEFGSSFSLGILEMLMDPLQRCVVCCMHAQNVADVVQADTRVMLQAVSVRIAAGFGP